MNAILLSVLRQVLTAAGTFFVSKGLIENTPDLETAIGGIIAMISVIWSVISKKKDLQVKSALAAQVKSTGQTPVVDTKS